MTASNVPGLESKMQSKSLLAVPLSLLNTGYERFRLVRPREYSSMVESVKQYGQISPATAGRGLSDPSRYELIDGFKRYHACKELGLPVLQLQVLEGGTRAWKAALIRINQSQGGVHAFEEALVAHSLYREDLLTQEQIGVLFGRHKSWACRRIAVCERLCDEAIEHIRLGLIGFATARALCKLPRGNQKEALSCVVRHRLNSRETEELVSLLFQSPRWEQEALLRLPLPILEKRSPPRPAGGGQRGVAKLFAELDRVCRELDKAQSQPIPENRRDIALEKVDITVRKLETLKAFLKRGDHGNF